MRLFLPLGLFASLACSGLLPKSEELPPAPPAPPETAAPESDISVVPNTTKATARTSPVEFSESVPGRYVVKFRDEEKVSVDENGKLHVNGLFDAANSGAISGARAVSGATGSVSGLFAVDTTVDEAGFRALMDNDAVEWVEPVQMWKLSSTDPYYRYQWNMAGLQIEQVHARANGKGVVVAVIDSGVTVGADGPANVLQGYDIFERDNDPSDSAAPTQSPSGSHGTHVAGTIAQLTNNGVGVAGVAPGASILPVRIGDYRGVSSENIAAGIIWATDNGAQVINMSVGGSSYARVVDEACRYAYDKGVVVVASSGNDGFDGKVSYPAAYPTVIAVGAHDGNNKETVYSNNGKELALLAPGGDTTQDVGHDGQPDGILQGTITGKGWGYAQMEGTSMASPHVAGAAAVLISAGVKGPDAVKSALVGGAKTVNGVPVLDILGALNYTGPVTPMVDPAADKATGPVADKGGMPGGRRPGVGPGRGGGREGKAGEGKGRGGRPGKGSKAERPGRNQ